MLLTEYRTFKVDKRLVEASIKENKSLLYTCNREYKKLYGGEELIFKNYPWGNGKKIFYENCFWHQKFYTFKPPFIKKYDGNIMHCLIDYSV